MASTELSANARKLQEEDIERLVKCRIRSEIEARKAAEATMKRAIQEARELKKELMIMRQEKEELKSDVRKEKLVAATTPATGGAVTKEDLSKKLFHEKAKHKEISTLLEQKEGELAELRRESDQRLADVTSRQSQCELELKIMKDELQCKQHDIDTLQEDSKKLKSTADEARRKCQKAVKEKKEELQSLMEENAQLSKRVEMLERVADENAKLRKQLEKVKDKQGTVAEELQRKLDQREQAFLRQEQDNKNQSAQKQHEIVSLTAQKDELHERIAELERAAHECRKAHDRELHEERLKYQQLVDSTGQLQERIQHLKDAGRAADRARLDAEARLEKEEELRETAEAAADATEIRAEKAENQLKKAESQLEMVEKALKKKGITMDFVLRQVSAGNNQTQAQSKMNGGIERLKTPSEPEDNEPIEPPAPKRKTNTLAQAPASTKDPQKAAQPANARVSGGGFTLSKPSTGTAKGSLKSSNNNHRGRELTPERERT